jgi:hypothetical protein
VHLFHPLLHVVELLCPHCKLFLLLLEITDFRSLRIDFSVICVRCCCISLSIIGASLS